MSACSRETAGERSPVGCGCWAWRAMKPPAINTAASRQRAGFPKLLDISTPQITELTVPKCPEYSPGKVQSQCASIPFNSFLQARSQTVSNRVIGNAPRYPPGGPRSFRGNLVDSESMSRQGTREVRL